VNSTKSRYRQPLLVGDRIRTLRKDRSLTQSELAASIGIQQSDLCRMENGEYKVSLETLFKILTIFQINIAEFFHEEAPPTISEKDVDFLREFQKLDVESQREVWDFIRFKRMHEDGVSHDLEFSSGSHYDRDHKKE